MPSVSAWLIKGLVILALSKAMKDSMQRFSDTPMVFVTGASRSGTTMLSRMFGMHSLVCGFKELHCFGELVNANRLDEQLTQQSAEALCSQLLSRSERDIWGAVEQSDIDQAKELLKDFPEGVLAGEAAALAFNSIAVSKNKTIPCEQTPRNIFYARQLLDFYPNLKIVHIVRDPRDVLASQKNRWKRRRFGAANIPYSEIFRVWCNYHPYTITKLWRKANSFPSDLANHDRFYVLKFEDMIENPEQELRKAAQFTGLNFESEMLNIAQVGSSHRSNADNTLGVARTALNRWKQALTTGEVFICEKVAAEKMAAFSYTPSGIGSKYNLSLLKQALKYPLHIVGVIASNPRRAWILMKATVVKAK